MIIALDSKIVTSSRNGELSLWDLNRSGTLKLGMSELKFEEEERRLIQSEGCRTEDQSSHAVDKQTVIFEFNA